MLRPFTRVLSRPLARHASFLSAPDMQHARWLLSQKNAFIIDCDGVLYHGDRLLPGAKDFVSFLQDNDKKYVFLTNSSDKTPEMLVEKFAKLGLCTEEDHFYTSAISTAVFLHDQKPGARAFVIGEAALSTELRKEGITVVDEHSAQMSTPDFVVVGETTSKDTYHFGLVDLAVQLVRRGARLIGTNEDQADRIGNELAPGTGSLILPIEACSGRKAYFVGKPNPLIVASARGKLNATRKETVVVGDRMNTDVKAGVEAQIDTVLVLSGVTSPADIQQFAFRPQVVLDGVGDIPAIVWSQPKRVPMYHPYLASTGLDETPNSKDGSGAL